jgi:hypothetical protein
VYLLNRCALLAGVDILSLVASDNATFGLFDDPDRFGNRYFASYTGTPQAAANVAGVAALCLDAVRLSCTASGALSNKEGGRVVFDCITREVDQIDGLARSTRFGGRVNARRAIECCIEACPIIEL